MSESDFRKVAELIRTQCGIALAPNKRPMVETRLKKRVRAVGLQSFAAYCEYVHSREGRRDEWPNLVDVVTTHKTDFFREPAHFDFLIDHALPELTSVYRAGIHRPLTAWSAACSTGEEPYSMAMVVASYADCIRETGFEYRIEASDISTAVVEEARSGIYKEASVQPVPRLLRTRYLLRSKDRGRGLVRISPEIRARVRFRHLNLMDNDYGFSDPFDIVFCRNVMIYFDRGRQQEILSRISLTLRIGGFLLMGHSESLSGLELPLIQVAPAVYRRAHG